MATDVDAMFALLSRERQAIVQLDAAQINASAHEKVDLAQRIAQSGGPLSSSQRQRLSRELRRNHSLLAFAQRCLQARTQRAPTVGLYTAHGQRRV